MSGSNESNTYLYSLPSPRHHVTVMDMEQAHALATYQAIGNIQAEF